MRKINQEARSVNRTTDVLSFPMHSFKNGSLTLAPEPWDFEYINSDSDATDETEDADADDQDETIRNQGERILHLGDICISLEAAHEQAEQYGHSQEREVAYLAVHGFLHLIGYDHEDGTDEAAMLKEAEAVMHELGLSRDTGSDILTSEDYRSGFIAIVGRPNVGKSTLLNRLTGTHIAITSAKAQTTRYNIRSIVTEADAQFVFIDTPGLHKSQHKLDNFMSKDSWTAAEDADVILLMVDASRPQITQSEKNVVQVAEKIHKPVILAINKADSLPKEELLPIIARFNRLYEFTNIIPISASAGDGVDDLLSILKEYLPQGPKLFDDDDYTDQSERQLAAEYIREQVLNYIHQEIPHGTAVLIDDFEEILADDPVDEYDRRLVRIEASILCDKDSHKGILIGKNGQTLKRISSSARIRLEELLGTKVYLKCFVKVRPDWRNRSGILNSLGFAGADRKKK